jgi:hypothetical protein
MSNIITDANQLAKVFDNAVDKLVVIMYTSKSNECKKAKNSYDKIISSHPLTIFCTIDVERFEGDSKWFNISSIRPPKFECFYNGLSIANLAASQERDIEKLIQYGERHVMTQLNNKNNLNTQNNNNNPLNPMVIQQQILTWAQQNPVIYNQLTSNPQYLQQMVNNKMQQLQMQMGMNQTLPTPVMTPTIIPTQVPTPPLQTTTLTTGQNQNVVNQIASMINTDAVSNLVPTIQQMLQMFKIFQMLHRMGVLDIDAGVQDVEKELSEPEMDNVITLPNGDKLVPLPGGKYGLIKNQN